MNHPIAEHIAIFYLFVVAHAEYHIQKALFHTAKEGLLFTYISAILMLVPEVLLYDILIFLCHRPVSCRLAL